MASKNFIQPSEWKRRRFRLDIALAAILILVCWIIFSGNDTVLYQQGLIALIGAGVALIGQYVFAAAWDDKNYMEAIKSLNAQDEQTGWYGGGYSQIPQSPDGEE